MSHRNSHRWKLEVQLAPRWNYTRWEDLGTYRYMWLARLTAWWVTTWCPGIITRIWRVAHCETSST